MIRIQNKKKTLQLKAENQALKEEYENLLKGHPSTGNQQTQAATQKQEKQKSQKQEQTPTQEKHQKQEKEKSQKQEQHDAKHDQIKLNKPNQLVIVPKDDRDLVVPKEFKHLFQLSGCVFLHIGDIFVWNWRFLKVIHEWCVCEATLLLLPLYLDAIGSVTSITMIFQSVSPSSIIA